MKTYKEFMNEGLIDLMTPKSDDDILNSLEGLNDSDKIISIIKNKLPYDLLPDNLTVKGDLVCFNNQLISLPNNLTVDGDLHCFNNQLTELPDDLVVDGNLDVDNNLLTKLPDNLTVNGDLDCKYNKVKLELPKDAKIGGKFIN